MTRPLGCPRLSLHGPQCRSFRKTRLEGAVSNESLVHPPCLPLLLAGIVGLLNVIPLLSRFLFSYLLLHPSDLNGLDLIRMIRIGRSSLRPHVPTGQCPSLSSSHSPVEHSMAA